MRQIIYLAAAAVIAMLLFRGLNQAGLVAPPDDPWFQAAVVLPSQSRPVVVKFGAEWCGPCRMLEAQLDTLAQRHRGKLLVVRVDIDERPQIAEHFGVHGIPDTLLFSGGRAVDRDVGYMNADQLDEWVKPWLP